MYKPAKFDTLSISSPRTRDVTTGIEYEMMTEGFPEGYVGFRAYLNEKFLVHLPVVEVHAQEYRSARSGCGC